MTDQMLANLISTFVALIAIIGLICSVAFD